jgi:hypothetical protein
LDILPVSTNIDLNSIVDMQTAGKRPDRRDPGNWPGMGTGLGAILCRDQPRSMAYLLIQPPQHYAAIPCHSRGFTNAIEFPFLYLEKKEEQKNGPLQQIGQ